MSEEQVKQLKKNLTRFIILLTEAEKYGYALKGCVKQTTAYRLNEVLRSSKLMLDNIHSFIDDELLANAGEELSKFMDMIIKDDEPPTETNKE